VVRALLGVLQNSSRVELPERQPGTCPKRDGETLKEARPLLKGNSSRRDDEEEDSSTDWTDSYFGERKQREGTGRGRKNRKDPLQ